MQFVPIIIKLQAASRWLAHKVATGKKKKRENSLLSPLEYYIIQLRNANLFVLLRLTSKIN